MGLFSSKQKKNIIDILGIQLSQEVESNLVDVDKQEDFNNYGISVKDNFELFDYVIVRIFGQTKDLSGNTQINLLFRDSKQSATIKKIQNLTNSISSVYGKDSRGESNWSKNDTNAISTFWTGRSWIVDKDGKSYREFQNGCIMITLLYDKEDGIDFSILNVNHLIKK